MAAPLWPRSGDHARRETRVATLLAMTAVLLFVVAIINVANLMLAEALRRTGEIALRRAMGMSASRLAGMMLGEVGIVAIGAAILGTAVCTCLNLVIQRSLLANVEWVVPLLSYGAVMATLGAALFACIVSELAVAVFSMRVDPASILKLATSAVEDLAILRVESIGAASTTLPDEAYRELADRVAESPYVESVALVTEAPLSSSLAMEVSIAGQERPPFIPTGGPYVNAVGDDALRTLGATIVSGRGFVRSDHANGAERVAIVNQTMARLGWRGGNPIGGCVKLTHDATCRRVIGVVHDMVRESIVEGPTMQLLVLMSKDLPRRPSRCCSSVFEVTCGLHSRAYSTVSHWRVAPA